MSEKRIVLVTGANGYIAGQTMAALLAAGYAVRGTVRSKGSAKAHADALSQYGDDLEIIEVPDIVAPGAFDAAVKGVHAIAHLAAPIGFHFTDPEPVLEAAVQGTVGILESALKEPTIKSVVLMSSVAAVASQKTEPYRFTEADWNLEALETLHKLGKGAPGGLIYSASKVASEQAFWKFRDQNRPAFAMSAVNPVFVMGPHLALDSVSQLSSTTAFIWKVFSGQEIPPPISENPAYVDVRDVARLVVFGVDNPEKANNQRYLASRGMVVPQAAADILRIAFPTHHDRIQMGTPGQGYTPKYAFPENRDFDGSKAVEATGQDHYAVEQSIIDTAKSLEKFL
ncbi:Fc.00g038660.m01.CDS01 [Cosmosporella sp. VM-42]